VNCTHCLEEYAPSVEEAAALGIPFEELSARTLRRGRGCLQCRQTGYTGRDGIFEILPMTDAMRRLVAEHADSARLSAAARQEGMRTLRESGIEKVLQGITTVSEMVRVAGF
jgi:type II secretory ATPase GspE/PulE/Tfp pilus assembly ATPase PilB-like protein